MTMLRFVFTVRREQIHVGSALVLRYSQTPTAQKPAVILIRGNQASDGYYGMLNYLAQALAFFGFHVFAPILDDTKGYLLKQESLETLKKIIKGIAELYIVKPEKIGIFGESFGSGLTLLAAEDPEINRNIRFILLFSPYTTIESAVQFAFSGKTVSDRKKERVVPDPYLRILFALNVLDDIDPTLDKAVLRQAFINYLMGRREWATDDIRKIGKRERDFFLSVLRGTDVGEAKLATLLEQAENYRNVLSPLTIQTDLLKPILIVHGITDNVLNCDQSRVLAEAITSSGGVTAHLSPLLRHQKFFSFFSNPWRWIVGFAQLSEVFFKMLVYFETYDLLKHSDQTTSSRQEA